MSSPKHSLSAGAVVFNDEGKILLIRAPRQGWEAPGGIIELGETIQDGIVREVKEETGIDIEITKFCGIYHNLKSSVCATCWGGELRTSSESLEVGFFSIEEALNMVTWSNFRERFIKILDEDEHPFCISF
ncbi:ADP-ribose pyrophosphatase [Virgibacillus soli]|uniref:ADP-ribose pyrophosphatase n=1 Tax=Lederbergia galactosidilytica TaxID=217031 RepID=A0A0Q9XXW3_9BACI|nr:NUDIX domain-containing protein [Lederbergia galactosidilytica]KRG12578.1 ADP-ribose pyrophosphatase [Virgibacillus soli]KRG13612.1 ADP-ribose pyrophosphatase [Lederbergia galactosidilytica]MBP1916044.1 8-oxo-dGTP pyrophosphatase MutT (NUDIX family) [Lederbergia galactosidilytica]